MQFVYEKMSLENAERALGGNDDRGCERPSKAMRRRPAIKERLLPRTLGWMMQLPHKLRPFLLARHYPRIANAICRRWKLTARCELYAHELLAVDHAGLKRRGFPTQAASEIAALVWHHTALNARAKKTLLAWHRVA